ncbi:MAG: aminopeptidase [Melioribacteraceae bacterium]|nr:MAG: aminopeptidase [Melioribacteraceae bacterium]
MLSRFLILVLAISIYAQENPYSISIDRIQRDLNFLGSDLFEGRGTGTTGGELSAKYLAKELDNAGLVPFGDNGTFYQYIPMHGTKSLPQSELKVYIGNNETINLKWSENYVLLKSGQQTFTPVPLPTVFAGYGITAPEFDYNDYHELDVQGKIVVIIEGEPISTNRDYFNGEFPTIYSYTESKLRIAYSNGAAGTIIITNPYERKINWDNIKADFSFEDIRLAYAASSNLSVLLNHDFAGHLFKDSDYTLDEVFIMHGEQKIKSFPLKSRLSFKGSFNKRDFLSANIIGLKRGRNKSDRYLIISAHYDHLGIGPAVKGDSIYNGVMDNAIGCAALLELARVFQEQNIETDRSIIFALVTGEEKGLLGSTYYTDHPSVPLYLTDGNINIDGVPYIDQFKSIVGVGSDLSSLGEILTESANKNNLFMSDIPHGFKSWESFNRSDQIAFAKAGIPSILVMEGPNSKNLTFEETIEELKYYNNSIYHTPFDDLNIKINYDAVHQYLDLLIDYIIDVSNSDKSPVWKDKVGYKIERLRTIAEKR